MVCGVVSSRPSLIAAGFTFEGLGSGLCPDCIIDRPDCMIIDKPDMIIDRPDMIIVSPDRMIIDRPDMIIDRPDMIIVSPDCMSCAASVVCGTGKGFSCHMSR